MKKDNYKGVKPAEVVTVLEGDGSIEFPYTEVQYVLGYQDFNGFTRMVTLGKIVPVDVRKVL